MNKELFHATMTEIYALFGRERVSTTVLGPLWDRVRDWPDGVCRLLVERLEMAERLPANLYREFRAAWEEWRRRNPERIVKTHCPVCGDRNAFDCWARYHRDGGDGGDGGDGADGNALWGHFVSPCPHCQTGLGRRPPTQIELRARGVEVMPPDYPGGPTAFDRDRGFGVLFPARWKGLPTEYSAEAIKARLAAKLGVDMTPDARRFAMLPPAERADSAAHAGGEF